MDSYEASLKAAGEGRDDIIGVVFVVNGKVTGAEVYGSNALFRKAWPKLLNSAAVEAVAERTDKPTTEPPSAREIEYFLARAAEPEPTNANGSESGNPPSGSLTLGGFAAMGEQNLDEQRITQTVTQLRSAATRGRQGRAAPNEDVGLNANIEVVAANDNIGQPNAPNRSGATQTRTIAQPNGSPLNYFSLVRPDSIVISGNTATGNRGDNQAAQPSTLPTGGVAGVAIQGNNATNDNVQLNSLSRVNGRAVQPMAPPTPTPDGNRLNSNFNENRSSLMVESRDPARQNAVIHRSYLKK